MFSVMAQAIIPFYICITSRIKTLGGWQFLTKALQAMLFHERSHKERKAVRSGRFFYALKWGADAKKPGCACKPGRWKPNNPVLPPFWEYYEYQRGNRKIEGGLRAENSFGCLLMVSACPVWTPSFVFFAKKIPDTVLHPGFDFYFQTRTYKSKLGVRASEPSA